MKSVFCNNTLEKIKSDVIKQVERKLEKLTQQQTLDRRRCLMSYGEVRSLIFRMIMDGVKFDELYHFKGQEGILVEPIDLQIGLEARGVDYKSFVADLRYHKFLVPDSTGSNTITKKREGFNVRMHFILSAPLE